MASPTTLAVHPSEAGHWYTRDGEPMYEVPSKAGTPRPTTLRDARTLFLVPGVSTIIRCAAAPGLERWKQEQVLLAALTLSRQALEPETEWVDRVFRDSREQGRAAAERGTEVHAILEQFYADEHAKPERAALCMAVDDAINAAVGIYGSWQTERAFAHPLGFGGKADLFNEADGGTPILLDIKTKDAWADDKRLAWDEHAIQLAAYRVGLGWPAATCANVFVSRQEPWQVHIHEWAEADIQRGWRMFTALLDYWKAKAGYDPAWETGDGVGPFF